MDVDHEHSEQHFVFTQRDEGVKNFKLCVDTV